MAVTGRVGVGMAVGLGVGVGTGVAVGPGVGVGAIVAVGSGVAVTTTSTTCCTILGVGVGPGVVVTTTCCSTTMGVAVGVGVTTTVVGVGARISAGAGVGVGAGPPAMILEPKKAPTATTPMTIRPTAARNPQRGGLGLAGWPRSEGSSSNRRSWMLPVLSMVNCSRPGSPRKRPAGRKERRIS